MFLPFLPEHEMPGAKLAGLKIVMHTGGYEDVEAMELLGTQQIFTNFTL